MMLLNAKTFLVFFSIQCVNYGLITWNYRAVAQARFISIFASDLCCAAVSFKLIKRIVKHDSHAAMAGYVLGGAVGSVLSAWITKLVYGQ